MRCLASSRWQISAFCGIFAIRWILAICRLFGGLRMSDGYPPCCGYPNGGIWSLSFFLCLIPYRRLPISLSHFCFSPFLSLGFNSKDFCDAEHLCQCSLPLLKVKLPYEPVWLSLMTWFVRRVGRSVIICPKGREVSLPCSYRSPEIKTHNLSDLIWFWFFLSSPPQPNKRHHCFEIYKIWWLTSAIIPYLTITSVMTIIISLIFLHTN